MYATMISPITPIMIIIWNINVLSVNFSSFSHHKMFTFKFCNQNFRLSFPACCSNCDAPCCSASARSSNSESFWSRSNTFSTFVFMISTTYNERSATSPVKCQSNDEVQTALTSSTCACVCWSRFCAAICWGVLCVGRSQAAELWNEIEKRFNVVCHQKSVKGQITLVLPRFRHLRQWLVRLERAHWDLFLVQP